MHSPALPVREVRCSSVGPQRLLTAPLPLAFQGARKRNAAIGCGWANTAAFPVWAFGFNWNNLSAFVEGGLYVHRLVCSFVAGLAGGVLGLPCIQRSDSYSVAVRGSLADCPFFPA